MSSEQLHALLVWLRECAQNSATADVPKLVFSGSVLAPMHRDSAVPGLWMREDGFAGYPAELLQIIECIVANKVSRVVFVGGDLHLSCVADLTLRTDNGCATATQIVASGLYAPLPFANLSRNAVEWTDTGTNATSIETNGFRIESRPRLLTDAPSHFVGVGIEPAEFGYALTVTAYDPTGHPLNVIESSL